MLGFGSLLPDSQSVRNTAYWSSTRWYFMEWCLVKHRRNFTLPLPCQHEALCLHPVNLSYVLILCYKSDSVIISLQSFRLAKYQGATFFIV